MKKSLTAIIVGIGLFIIATIPFVILLANNQKVEVNIKSADQSLKELTLQNEDLVRGRIAERDSSVQYKKEVSTQLEKKDSTINVLEKKLNKEEVINKELKQEVDSIKKVLKNIKWSDIKPVGESQ